MPDKKGGKDKDHLPKHLRNAPGKFDYLNQAYEPEPDPNATKHLGAMNGWSENKKEWPELYLKCQHKQGRPHKLVVTHLSKSRNRGYCSYKCEKCNIEWTVDSTD